MELGGSSSSSSNSPESLYGLKFGQKIYFENVGFGVPAKTASGSLPAAVARGSTPASPAKKRRSVMGQAGQPPRCQVEGCKADLSAVKAYYLRHKVCGMHSKSPKAIVAGLEQRFCQQCSRFHQLPEFDQGKRSCRRRLAGHNERRRKPPPGSLLSPHHGNVPPSIFLTNNNSSRTGSFLMDFTAYPWFNGRDPWPKAKSSERVSNSSPTITAKFHLDSENPPPDLFLHDSASRTAYLSPDVLSGHCLVGSSDSSCALSLLSNQPWFSRNRTSSITVDNILNVDGPAAMVSPPPPPVTQVSAFNHFPSTSWDFRGNEASGSSHNMPPNLGLSQITPPANTQNSYELELGRCQSGRQDIELEHTSAECDPTAQHVHWSL